MKFYDEDFVDKLINQVLIIDEDNQIQESMEPSLSIDGMLN
jgi:hypothetical protein